MAGTVRRTGLWAAALLAASCGSGSSGGDAEVDAEVDPYDEDEHEEEEACLADTSCLPLSWSCDGDGDPVECSVDGSGWIPRGACDPGQACDPRTGWCECGQCEVPVEGGCLRVGPSCPAGWVDDGACGCEPVLEACAADEITLVAGGCAPVGVRDACGTGTWGSIPTDPSSIFVDGSYTGGGSDGTSDRPFTTIREAVEAAPASPPAPTVVAIAAGTYAEAILLDRPVCLVGRCPSLVTISPPGGSGAAVEFRADACCIDSMTVDGGGAVPVGVRLGSGAGLAVRNTVVRAVTDAGIHCQGCVAGLTDVSISDVVTGGAGDCLQAYGSDTSPASLSLESVDMQGCGRHGVLLYDLAARIERCRIEGSGDYGIVVHSDRPTGGMTLSANRILGPRRGGILMFCYGDVLCWDDVSVERNLVSGVVSDPSDTYFQPGIQLGGKSLHQTMTENVVEACDEDGVVVWATSPTTVESNLVRDTGRRSMLFTGNGAETIVEGNTVRRAGEMGVVFMGAGEARGGNLRFSGNTVDVVEPAGFPPLGYGVDVQDSDDAVIESNVVSGSSIALAFWQSGGEQQLHGNYIEAQVIGIDAEGQADGAVLTVEGNRVVDGAVGMMVYDSPESTVMARDNRFGPLSMAYPYGYGYMIQAGMAAHGAMSVVFEGNLIHLDPPDPETTWSFGIATTNALDMDVSSNRVVGANTLGTVHSGRPGSSLTVGLNEIVGVSGVGILLECMYVGLEASFEGSTVVNVGAEAWPSGGVYGDGIDVIHCAADSSISIQGNSLLGNDRAGFFVSDAPAEARDNVLRQNAIAMAWQDGADVVLGTNLVECNGADQPLVDGGLAVPEPPDVIVPP